MSESSTEVLLFDLGGVVFQIDFERAVAHWAAHAGESVHTIKSRYCADEWYERHERGEISAAQYFDALRDRLGITISDEQFAAGWNAIFGRESTGMFELLQSLSARIPVYAFSNSNVMHQAFWERKYAKTLSLFRNVFVSSDLGMRKPEAEAYRHVAACIGVEPQRVLFFDDTRENIDGARDIGMFAVHVRDVTDIRASVAALLE